MIYLKRNYQIARANFLKVKFNKYSFINSLKAIFACLVGLGLADLFNLQQPQWVLISILIVMATQYRLGGAILKGYARLIATILGSSVGAAILFLFSDNPPVTYSLLFLFIALFIYLANNSKDNAYPYTLGAVTMVIIVVSNHPQLKNALDRLIEILMGVSIAIIVSRFIFPIHAEKLLYKNIANTLRLLQKVYCSFIREDKTFSANTKDINSEDLILENFANQPVLIKEASLESLRVRNHHFKLIVLLRLQRRLLRSIYMLHYTLRVSLRSFHTIFQINEFTAIHQQIINTLENLAHKIENPTASLYELELDYTYQATIKRLRAILDHYTFEEKIKLYAFIFCLGHVISVLKRMKRIVLEVQQT